jgi:hypothetical protein
MLHAAQCQVSKLIPMGEYIKQHCQKSKKAQKLRTDRERKNYLTKTLGLTLQKDPKRGILCVPMEQDTLMMSGMRMSTSRVKEEGFSSKEESKEQFRKASEAIQGSTNSKVFVGRWGPRVLLMIRIGNTKKSFFLLIVMFHSAVALLDVCRDRRNVLFVVS